VGADNTTTRFFDRLSHGSSTSARLIEPAFARAEAFRTRFRFARSASCWCPLDHDRESILASASVKPGVLG
jgi:hypothetical protein